jgi:hypothetical protein
MPAERPKRNGRSVAGFAFLRLFVQSVRSANGVGSFRLKHLSNDTHFTARQLPEAAGLSDWMVTIVSI